MVYGYVNRSNGDTESFLKDKDVDKIIYSSEPQVDLSFANKEDVVIFKEIPSVANNLQEFVDFARVSSEIGIDIEIGNSLKTKELDGKFLIDLFAIVSRYSEKFWGKQ